MADLMAVNGWRVMWLIAVFDCPVKTKPQRKAATNFRKSLLKENFMQYQYSIYLRHFPTLASANAEIELLKYGVPKGGNVSFFILTDKQYGMTREFLGHISIKRAPMAPDQLQLF
ncbi:MAG TPA: CRISPR-associated endonuclease Cas2 [Candidatus Nanopelagicaceae bacterium]|nr:CRISPR-associated endonuclease Cas2 [Candidatus Nanopelagicaceae bacterium]